MDSLDIIVAGYNQLAGKYNARQVDPEDIGRMIDMSIAERCRFLNFKLYLFPLAALDMYKLYRQSLKRLRFFAGMRKLLVNLHERGFQLGVISTNSEHIIREFLHNNGIDFVNDMHCSNNLFGKDKEIKRFLKAHKLKSSEMIYVGDEARDIVACKKTGVPVIWVSWGYDTIENIKKLNPDYIVNNPDEILGCIQV